MAGSKRSVSLMSSGLHGENGLDPDTFIHLMPTYAMPVLMYGLEVAFQKQRHLDRYVGKVQQKVPEINTLAASECC